MGRYITISVNPATPHMQPRRAASSRWREPSPQTLHHATFAGATKTPFWKRGPRASVSAEDSAKLARSVSSVVPLGRWGEPEEVAKAVLFLASDDSSYVNAVELMVDGGPRVPLSEFPF